MTKRISKTICGFALIAGLAVSNKSNAQNDLTKLIAERDSLINVKANDLINTGYLYVDKKNVIGSVSTVKEGRIKEMAALSVDALLQGQAAGVRVANTSGAPGAGAYTIIRGVSTLNAGTAPLYIVDGIPVKSSRVNSLGQNIDNNPLADINPQDIASITVLKDGHATAIYGMRGSNGVIVINTYGGTSGKTYLDVSVTGGITQLPKKQFSVLDANGYKSYILEKEQARGFTQQQINNGVGRYLLLSTPADQVERYNNNTDWQDQAIGKGVYNDYHLNLRGGDAVAKYALNLGYTKQKGIIDNTDLSRFAVRVNLDYKVGRKLSILNTLSYTRTDRNASDEGNAFNSNPLVLSALKNPMLTAFEQNNLGEDLREIDSADYGGRNNPYAIINGLNNSINTNRILGRITGQYTFSPSLNLRVTGAGDYYRLNEFTYKPAAGIIAEAQRIRSASAAQTYELMVLNENTLNFSKTLNGGKHAIDATVGMAYQNTQLDGKTAVYINAPSDLFSGISSVNFSGSSEIPATDPNIDSVGSYSPVWKLLSFFATANYVLNDKYIFGANFRTDGSSRFAKGNRWGYFPSVAAAWILSKESFLKNSKFINELKLRSSFGISGNQEVGFLNSYNALVSTPYSRYSGLRIAILGNPDFTWEQTKQANIGVDAAFLKGRLGLSAEAYTRTTDNLYNTIKLPTISGFESYAVSEGSMRNKGVELSVYGKVLNSAFGWETNLTAAYNKNEILSLPEKLVRETNYGNNYRSIVQIGNSAGAFYGYNALGVYANSSDVKVKNGNNDANPFKGGDIIFEDLDGNGIINENDQKVIGNSNPDFYGGFSNTFSFKGFDLNAFIDFSVGNEVYNAQRTLLESMSNYDNQSTTINSRWRKDGDITSMPRLLHGDAVGNTRFSSRWIEDGSYVRFKAVTLGYNFPMKKIFKGVVKTARAYVTAQNLYTFSDYKGYNPDVASISNAPAYGVDYGNMPQLKAFLVGIKLGL